MALMTLTIGCSYCGAAMVLKIGDLTMQRRAAKIGPPFKCSACGSTTQLEFSTKRVRKGAGMKRIEAERVAKFRAELQRRQAANKLAGDALLAQPGCTCAERVTRAGRCDVTWHGNDTGHPLSTGWSRDRDFDAMFPTTPRHLHGCPLFNTNKEH